jgi:hypothetical protein
MGYVAATTIAGVEQSEEMTMEEKPRLARQAMRSAGDGVPGRMDCESGRHADPVFKLWIPQKPDLHSENGVTATVLAKPEEADRHLVNAGGQNVTPVPHGNRASRRFFRPIRKGMVDVTVMGAYEVAENGDFANGASPTVKVVASVGQWT